MSKYIRFIVRVMNSVRPLIIIPYAVAGALFGIYHGHVERQKRVRLPYAEECVMNIRDGLVGSVIGVPYMYYFLYMTPQNPRCPLS